MAALLNVVCINRSCNILLLRLRDTDDVIMAIFFFFFFSLKISYALHTGKTMIANMLMIKIAYLT